MGKFPSKYWVGVMCWVVFAACVGGGAERAEALPLVSQRGPYVVEVLVNGVQRAPTYHHRGQHFVLGSSGARYTVRVHNRSSRRVEAVVSVDGRDVLDGKKAGFQKRGYIVAPWSHVDIDGWRLSNAEVAAFRFSSVRDSYAAKTGDAWDVGVIGVAIFSEYAPPPPPPAPLAPPSVPVYTPVPDSDDPLAGLGDYERAPRRGSQSSEGTRRGKSAASEAPNMRSSAESSAAYGEGAPSSDALDAPSARGASRQRRAEMSRPGLGTEFGEVRHSSVYSASFDRRHGHPDALLGVRYNDRDGLIALGIDIDGRLRQQAENRRRLQASPFQETSYAEPPPGWSY